MTNVTFQRKELEKHIKLTPEVIEKISLFGTPLERVTSEEIEIEIFPDRPDLISMQGFLRGFKAFLNKPKSTGLNEYKINKPQKHFKVKIDESVSQVRPYTACAIVKNLNFNDEKIKEIIDLQEKLHITAGRNRKKVAIGIYPLEKIKLPIKYEARKPVDIKFIPLDSTREMSASQILKRHPAGITYADLLKGQKVYPLFIDSNNKILSMPPIINSNETGKVTHETKEVFVECSGSDFQTLQKILNIIITTLHDMGGQVYQMHLEYSHGDKKNRKIITPNLTPESMKISLENTNKLLGLTLKEKDLSLLLPKMGYDYNSKTKTVSIPAWRTDILHEVDIIEDIAIAYGYDKFIPEIPLVSTVGEESKLSKLTSKISEILIGLGLTEISSYHLIKDSEAYKAKLKDSDLIALKDSKTEYKILRPCLTIPLLRILSENKDNDYPQNIFEIGTVFEHDTQHLSNNETKIKEKTSLAIALTPGNFTQAKQYLNALMRSLGLSYTLQEDSHALWIEGRTARILVNNKPIGKLGEVHPKTLRDYTLKMPLAMIKLNLDEIFRRLD